MKKYLLLFPLLLAGCDAPQAQSGFQYVNKSQFEGADFVFDRQTGYIAEIDVEFPKEITAEQFQAQKVIPETLKGFKDWKYPKSFKKGDSR